MRMRARLALIAGASIIVSGVTAVGPATAGVTTAAQLPALLNVAAEVTTPAYDRDLFQHWVDDDSDGCNTRNEVLIEESSTPVSIGSNCALSGGTWTSPFDGAVWTSPTDLEIDHLVALSEAWRSGAWSWDSAQRRAFANDMAVPYALNAITSSVNSQKSAWDPAWWLPSQEAYVCTYVTDWALMKYRWSLTIDDEEQVALQSILSGDCGELPVTLPTLMMGTGEAAPEPDITLPPAQTVIAPFVGANTRLGGSGREAVAVGVSQRYQSNVPVVYVAMSTNFPDALSAAAAAAHRGGPLLLTPTASLPEFVAAEIRRLAPHRIVVVGGEGAVSPRVFSQLQPMAPVVERQGGRDRYDASYNITAGAFASSDQAMIATGRTFPDALSASGAAGKVGAPVILVDGMLKSVPSRIIGLLTDLGVTTVNIAGGIAVMSPSIETQLRNAGFTVNRFGGADRFAVAAGINSAFFGSETTVGFFATGLNFPDAMAGAALAGRLGAPLFITLTACIPPAVFDVATRLNLEQRVFLGGPAVVGEGVVANTRCAPPAPKPPAPPKPPTPSKPTNPGDTKNCTDFSTWRQAQDWYLRYYAHYGDIARLDADKDGVACENLQGAPR